jgi:hypothetical protein
MSHCFQCHELNHDKASQLADGISLYSSHPEVRHRCEYKLLVGAAK